jgi:hypothetical protein
MTHRKFFIDVKHVMYERVGYTTIDLPTKASIEDAKKYALTLKSDISHEIERIVIKDSSDEIVAVINEIKDGLSDGVKEKQARIILKELGFAVENLWQVSDVMMTYSCTEEEAMSIMNKALSNEATMNQIWESIDSEASMLGFEKE